MSEILILASDFIERMSNPAYGVDVNEEYSLRFAKLLTQERTYGLLAEEASRVRDVDALSAHGWLWFLNWVRAHDLALDGDLLLDLADHWASVFMQVLIIDLGTLDIGDRHLEGTRFSLNEFPHWWTRKLLQSVVRQEREVSEGESRETSDLPRTARAETVLIALLQVGRPITVAAAATLLDYSWAGREQLRDFFYSRAADWDVETQRSWASALRMKGLPYEGA